MACTHDHGPPGKRISPMFPAAVHKGTLNLPAVAVAGLQRRLPASGLRSALPGVGPSCTDVNRQWDQPRMATRWPLNVLPAGRISGRHAEGSRHGRAGAVRRALPCTLQFSNPPRQCTSTFARHREANGRASARWTSNWIRTVRQEVERRRSVSGASRSRVRELPPQAPTRPALTGATAHDPRGHRLQAAGILARRHAHEHLLDDAPIQRVLPRQRLEGWQRHLAPRGAHARPRHGDLPPPKDHLARDSAGPRGSARGLMCIARPAEGRPILFQHGLDHAEARAHHQLEPLGFRIDQEFDKREGFERWAFQQRRTDGLCETSSWRLLCGEACCLGWVTTRVPRAVTEPPLQFSTVSGTSPALVPPRGKVYSQGSRFPETATTSPGVLQLGPCCPSSRLVSPEMAAGMITSPHSAPLAGLLQRVRDEYREMPKLKLTKPQATRLFGVAPSVCAAVLRALVMENFLSRTGEGEFVRSTT